MRRGRIGGALLAAFAVAGAWAVLGAGAASASSWKLVDLPDEGVRAALYGISCPTAQLCVSVGGNNTVASSTNPAGDVSAWRIVRPGGGLQEKFPGMPPGGTYAGGQIRGVSCPTAGLCVAGSFEGDIYSSTNPTGPAEAWRIVPLTAANESNIHIGGVSCPTVSLCVAAALGGKVVVSTNPTGERDSWTVIELDRSYDLRGVHCASVSLCVAVGNEGSVVVSTNPTGGPGAWTSVGQPGGEFSKNAVACPSPTLCVTANASHIVTSTSPSVASSWSAIAAGPGLPVKGVSCPSPSACAAVDNNADVIVSTNPAGGAGAWSFKNVLPYRGPESPKAPTGTLDSNGMFAISCASTALCVTAGQEYRLLVSTDPFAADAVKPVRGTANSKRPRVRLTRHPAKRTEPRKRGATPVVFRFRAVGAKARGFRCKLTGKRFRPCKSPSRYKLRRGKHTFKVRALPVGGGRPGRITTFHFRIGKLTERPPVGSCPQGSEGSLSKPCVRARG
jgi:hypothetical protein